MALKKQRKETLCFSRKKGNAFFISFLKSELARFQREKAMRESFCFSDLITVISNLVHPRGITPVSFENTFLLAPYLSENLVYISGFFSFERVSQSGP